MGCCASTAAVQQQQQQQHEEDLTMVERLLDRDGTTLDAGTTTLLIWKCRRDPRLIALATSWLEKHAGAKQAYDDVEMYLPQLAHMLVHLDVDWPAGTLERFALVVAQQSPHFALQLHWILRSAMEDYAPSAAGRGGHELYYRRCAHLDEEIESCVAYLSALPAELEELFVQGKIDGEELGNAQRKLGLEVAKRMVNDALRPILFSSVQGTEVSLVDPWMVPHRTAAFSSPVKWSREDASAWKSASAKIESRSLLVYDMRPFLHGQPHGAMRRALPLDRAWVTTREPVGGGEEWAFEFTVHAREGTSAAFSPVRLRAETAAGRAEWLRHIGQEASRAPRPLPLSPTATSPSISPRRAGDPNNTANNISNNTTDVEKRSRRRYDFFEAERTFADDLVAVAEDLRALPREERQAALAAHLRAVPVPPLAYLPLCNSTDPWRTVLSIVPDEGFVFNTKQRCPCLVYFETAFQRGFEGVDLANLVHAFVSRGLDEPLDDEERAALQSSSSSSPPSSKQESLRPSADPRATHRFSDPNPDDRVFKDGESLTAQLKSRVSRKLSVWRCELTETASRGSSLLRRSSETARDSAQSPIHEAVPEATPEVAGAAPGGAEESTEGSALAQVTPDPPQRGGEAGGDRSKALKSRRKSRRSLASEQTAARIRQRATRVLDHWTKQFALAQETGAAHAERVFGSSSAHAGGGGGSSSGEAGEGRSATADGQSSRKWRSKKGGGLHWGASSSSSSGLALTLAAVEWRKKEAAVRTRSSQAAGAAGWGLEAIIVKSNDDLRQEVFVVQLVKRYERHFRSLGLSPATLYLRPYRIVALSASTGLVELIEGSVSLDRIYKQHGTLEAHFDSAYGPIGTARRDAAVLHFIASLAAAAYIEYALAVKDRHNGNILLTADGNIIQIDFGFVLGIATGGCASLERAPFKLTSDMVNVMGGVGSRGHALFVESFATALVAGRSIVDETSALIEIMQFNSRFPCFLGGRDAVRAFRERHSAGLSDDHLRRKSRCAFSLQQPYSRSPSPPKKTTTPRRRLVAQSLDHAGVRAYDRFQLCTNGIAY